MISYDKFYVDPIGRKKTMGIYSPGLDRFILVDNYDFNMTLKTAQIWVSLELDGLLGKPFLLGSS